MSVAVAAAIGIAVPSRGADDRVELSGRGEFRATYLNLDEDVNGVLQGGEAEDFWTLGGGGALDLAWRALNVQGDFSVEANVDERSADDTYRQSYGGGLHAGWRDPEFGSLHAWGAVGNVDITDVDGPNPDTVAWGIGLEGQAFFDAFTLYAQAGYLDRESVSSGGDVDALKNAGFGRVVGRYFASDDIELEAEIGYAQGKMDPDGDKIWLLDWAVGGEARCPGTPVAGFIGYTGARYDQSDDDDVLYEHRIGFGVRVYFGRPTLRANDRRGASLELPRYLEWNGQIAGALE